MMISRRLLLLAVAVGVLLPGTRLPHAEAEPTTAPASAIMIPEIKVDSVGLEDFVDFLRDATGANIVLTRERGAAPDYPIITMHLKRVTLKQVLDVLQQGYPRVNHTETDPPENPVYIVHVEAPPAVVGLSAQPVPAPVQVYNLRDVVAEQRSQQPKSDDKQAMSDVMTAVQTALEQLQGNTPILKVHEATETLVCNGSPEAQALVAEVLKTLGPDEQELKQRDAQANQDRQIEEMAAELDRLQQRLKQVTEERDNAIRQNVENKARTDTLDAQVTRLSDELGEAQARARQAEANYDALTRGSSPSLFGGTPATTKP